MITAKLFQFCSMCFVAFSMLLISTGCKKTIENTSPQVDAGASQIIVLPATSCLLKGRAYDMQKNIVSLMWKKVSGPDRYVFKNAGALETEVLNLETGEYKFMLTAIDKDGLQASATVKVKLLTSGNNEVIFENLPWDCSWGCSVAVRDIYSSAPRTGFQVSIRDTNFSSWDLVKNEDERQDTDKYTYGVYDNTLYVSAGDDPIGEVDLKVTY